MDVSASGDGYTWGEEQQYPKKVSHGERHFVFLLML